jgi:hypothetical protein
MSIWEVLSWRFLSSAIVSVLMLLACKQQSKEQDASRAHTMSGENDEVQMDAQQLPKARRWSEFDTDSSPTPPPPSLSLAEGSNHDVPTGPQKSYWCSRTWQQVPGVLNNRGWKNTPLPVGKCAFVFSDYNQNYISSCTCRGKPIAAVYGTEPQNFPPTKAYEYGLNFDGSFVFNEFFYIGDCGAAAVIARVHETTTCELCPIDDHILGDDGKYPEWDSALENNQHLFQPEHMAPAFNTAFGKAKVALNKNMNIDLESMRGPGRRTGNYQRHLVAMHKIGKLLNDELNYEKYLSDPNKFHGCQGVVAHAVRHWGKKEDGRIAIPSQVGSGVKAKKEAHTSADMPWTFREPKPLVTEPRL